MKYDKLYYRNLTGRYCPISLANSISPYNDHGIPGTLICRETISIYNEHKYDDFDYGADNMIACVISGYMVRARLIKQFGFDYAALIDSQDLPDLRCAAKALDVITRPTVLDYFYLNGLNVPKDVDNYGQIITTILRDIRLICLNNFGAMPDVIVCSPTIIRKRKMDSDLYWDPINFFTLYASGGFNPLPKIIDTKDYIFYWQLYDWGKGVPRQWRTQDC